MQTSPPLDCICMAVKRERFVQKVMRMRCSGITSRMTVECESLTRCVGVQVKKAIKEKDGAFRAMFEDKVASTHEFSRFP